MNKSSKSVLGCMLAAVALLGGCDRAPPLPPELARIKCPADSNHHASAMFAKARVTFVCISKRVAKDPSLLRCDLNSYPMVCGDEGQMIFSRVVQGEVYAGLLPGETRQRNAAAPGLFGSSRLELDFRPAPPQRSWFEEADTNWDFMVREARDFMPTGFTLVKGALCERTSGALNGGICKLEARSASLYWRIAVRLHADRGTALSASQYRDAMAFWFPLLEKLVEDPAGPQKAR